MAVHVIQKGLDLPIKGAPEQRYGDTPMVGKVAVLARDYPFMKPRMHVQVGDQVKRGQLLFEDRKTEGVRFTSPGAGTVAAINRGARRALQSVVIDLTASERRGKPEDAEHQPFESFTGREWPSSIALAVLDLLVESGLWTALRQRPFSNVPSPASSCHSIFVTAIDTEPLSPDPESRARRSDGRFSTGSSRPWPSDRRDRLPLPRTRRKDRARRRAPGSGGGVQRQASGRAGWYPHPSPRPGLSTQGGLVHRLPGRCRDRQTLRNRETAGWADRCTLWTGGHPSTAFKDPARRPHRTVDKRGALLWRVQGDLGVGALRATVEGRRVRLSSAAMTDRFPASLKTTVGGSWVG